MTHPTCDLPDNVPDELVPDPQVAREFNVTLMTLWRWDHDPQLAESGWEPPVKIRKRNYRRRRPLEKFKAALRNFGIPTATASPPAAPATGAASNVDSPAFKTSRRIQLLWFAIRSHRPIISGDTPTRRP
jgi:hypothetical protein